MFNFTTLLVEKPIDCPNCGYNLNTADLMFRDDDRNDVICGYCKDDYIEAVISEEGVDGELVR